jgi:hypothetical protein
VLEVRVLKAEWVIWHPDNERATRPVKPFDTPNESPPLASQEPRFISSRSLLAFFETSMDYSMREKQ